MARFCDSLRGADFIAVDTEFMRERTYWPILCLVHVAGPEAAAIDALAPGIDLAPLLALLADEQVLKVFHAARQDIEIFFYLSGAVPRPLFDTQMAAMVCGPEKRCAIKLASCLSGSDPLILQDNALDAEEEAAARCKVFRRNGASVRWCRSRRLLAPGSRCQSETLPSACCCDARLRLPSRPGRRWSSTAGLSSAETASYSFRHCTAAETVPSSSGLGGGQRSMTSGS